ncbi:MAG: hypothetical protein DI537_10205 [Stutzerimonas stutzeri]|nr:MAG: hypothetical protein DI537_10205 [Stutzerimonas stutzeri]
MRKSIFHFILGFVALAIGLNAVAAIAQSRNDPKTMQRLWFEANGACRGGSGDDPKTHLACDEREAYAKRLNQLGWCYGKKGEFGYQQKWHRCSRNSVR